MVKRAKAPCMTAGSQIISKINKSRNSNVRTVPGTMVIKTKLFQGSLLGSGIKGGKGQDRELLFLKKL